MSHRASVAVVFVLMMFTASCRETSATSPPGDAGDKIVFPLQGPTDSVMQALLEGTLILRDRCLYVASNDPPGRVLPIWPEGFSYRSEEDTTVILDADDEVVAAVDAPVSMGGGMAGEDESPLPPELAEQVAGCRGPYWIVGEI
jgi:hypothetical protein